MIDALFDVGVRLPEGVEVLGLGVSHVAELLDWEAEKYRKSLDVPVA